MRALHWTVTAIAIVMAFVLGWTMAGRPALGAGDEAPAVKGWQKGKGWGPWGKDDEVGSLNATTPASMKAALAWSSRARFTTWACRTMPSRSSGPATIPRRS